MFGTLSLALQLCHQENTEEKKKLCGTEMKRILLLKILKNEFLFHIFTGSLKILNNSFWIQAPFLIQLWLLSRFATHEVRFLLVIYSWMCALPLEHGLW